MPRPRKPDPSPSAERSRQYEERRRAGLVLVQIGGDRYEVTEKSAERIRRIAKAPEPKDPS